MKKWYKAITKTIKGIFRDDLQLHFLWSYGLTTIGIYYTPMIFAGIILTILKEALDLWSKGNWSWDDFWFGLAGWVLGILVVASV
jgi:hypothetical protein